ncbi:tudor domain-containing protein 15-like [Diretmus argenteus]
MPRFLARVCSRERCPDSGPSAPCALWPVDLKLTHLNWDPEAALIHFQGQYLTICELDYIILQTEIQNRPKTKAAVDIGEFCLVEDVTSACWYRGRVQKRREDLFDVFLIDHGNVLSVDIAHVSLCSNDLFSLPPKIVCGFLANVLLFQDCCSSAVEQYFSTLIGQNVTGYIQALLPHKVLIVEAIDINNNLIKLGFGRRMDTDTFLLLVEMLTDVPLKQNIKPVPDLLIEKPRGQEFSFKPSSLSGYEDIIAFCGPRLRVGTRVKVRVTAAVNPRLFYCQMTSMEMELRAMSAQLATACESRSKDPRQESPENLGLFCSVKRGKDEKWYRGFLQFLPINSQVRVRYVDYGFCESVKVENVQRLPPDFLSTPIMAFPCSLSSMTDQDEAVKTQQLSLLQRGLLGGVLDAEICSFDEEQNLYSITVVHADDNSHTKEPNPIQELPKIKIETALEQMPPEGGYFYYKAVMAEALGKSLQTEEVQVDSVFVGYVEHVLNPNHFWIRTQKRNHDFEVMMEEMFDYFCQVKLDEDVLENPELGTLCCAMYENDMHFYRGVVVDTLKHGAEVLFIDFGNIEKVPHMLIKKIPERFASEPPFALCCTLNVIPVLVDVWTTANSAFFRKAVSNRALRVNVVHLRKDTFVVDLYPMGSDDDQSITELLISSNQADYLSHIPSETVKQKTKEVTRCQALLVEQGLAREVNVSTKLPSSICPDSFIYSSFNLRSGSEEQVYITHVSSPWEVYCQLDKNNEIIEELEKKVSVVSEEMMQADTSAVVGKLCLAKYLDGKWYRGLAHPVPSPLHLAVFFVDYGNETLSEKINVMFIPCDSAELLFTPMQAVRCRLAQVPKEELYAEVKQWLYETIINKNVRAVVVGKSEDGSIEIELFDGDVHINEKVKELILSLTPKPKTVVSVHIDDTKTKHKHTPIKRHNFGRTSSNPPKSNARGCSHVQNVGCKSKANAMRCVPKKPQTGRKGKQPEHHDHIHPKSEQLPHAEEMPKLSSLPDNKVNAGFSAKCYISHIDSVKSFFLQMQEDEPSILKMCHDLNPGLCRDSLMKTNPVALRINDLVLAEYEEDGALYRAVVKGYEGSARFKVEFVDYGNSAVMARERIYPITREYLSQPRFSIPCSLLDTSTYETDASFTDAVMEKPLMVKFVSRFGTHWEVKIEILDGETASPVLNEATAETGNVTEKGREATASPTRSQNVTVTAQGEPSLNTSPPQRLFFAPIHMDKVYFGFAAAVTTPFEFCVTLESSLPVMITVSVMLDDLSGEMPPLPEAHLIQGSCCLLESDMKKKLCRAEILHTDDAVVVNLVDYGYHMEMAYKECSKLKRLPEELARLPKVTYPCILRGVKPVQAEGQWTEEAAVFFQQCLYQKNLQIFFREFISGTHWSADVSADSVDVAKLLVAAGHAAYTDPGLGLSAFHPESQGALERFHATLKSMLRAYCLEFEKDWDNGVHLVLFAVREVVQESLGFSPSELIFAHSVRGPLKMLKESWIGDSEPQNLLDYVSDFRFRLRRACELARENLSVTQKRMKGWYDQKAENRVFAPGDKVLVLLPIPGSTLQARFSGPYLVKEKVGDRDYLVATPERRRRCRLCHVNMLKPYHERGGVALTEPSAGPDEPVVTSVALSTIEGGEELDVPSVAMAFNMDVRHVRGRDNVLADTLSRL